MPEPPVGRAQDAGQELAMPGTGSASHQEGVEPSKAQAAALQDEISVFAVGSVLLQHRWRILQWAVIVGLLATAPVLLFKRTWSVTASFVPQGAESGQSGLRSLAGQFGLALPGGLTSMQSPELYEQLIASPVVLGAIVEDTIEVIDNGAGPHAVADLLRVKAADPAQRRQDAIRELREKLRTDVALKTGVVTISVKTKWPQLSFAITESLLDEVNRFNLQTRQAQAAAERRFVEARLAAQRQALAEAEVRLANFLQANRQFDRSPDLVFEYERLQREVVLQQQVLIGLAQSYEETRIREVRDVPVITILEPPTLPARPDRRGLALRASMGLLVGAMLGVLLAFSKEMYARRKAEGDAAAARFAMLLMDARRDLTRWTRR